MQLGGRLSAAIEILRDMGARRRPVSDALKDWGLSHRFAGSGDRAAIGNIVYDVLRKKLSLAWRMESEDPRHLVYAAALQQAGAPAAKLLSELGGDRFSPEPLETERLSSWTGRSVSDAPAHVQADLPEWCAPLFEAVFGAEWVAEGAALSGRPPLDLRVNTLKSTPQRAMKELARHGARTVALLPTAIRIPPAAGYHRHPNVQAEAAFQKGWVEVQDLGSQLASAFAAVSPGEQVLDFCAGAGGKTLALAAAMENRGQIHAYDADRQRLAPIYDRLKRAGARNVQVHAEAEALSSLEGRMDLVLVDAPCTGSGTWRRRPDAKWRLGPDQLADRVEEQHRALREACRYVRPGGRLVYITCSLFQPENGKQISDFLAEDGDFRVIEPAPVWKDVAMNDDAARPLFRDHGVVMSPASPGTDGFHCACVRRASN